MKNQKVEITSTAIKKVLNKYSIEKAISEYIWNGFDAKASTVNINFEIESKDLGTYRSISVSDNGNGINFEELEIVFRRFYESKKYKTSSNDLIHGKHGYGRFTFYKYAQSAKWNTTYAKDEQNINYQINIISEDLIDFSTSETHNTNDQKGTSVTFEGVSNKISPKYIEDILKPYLRKEFAWFLELKEEFKIFVDNEELDYSSNIAEREPFTIEIDKIKFNCKYIQWNSKLNDEFSRFYFLNTNLDFKNSKTTLLNKKNDNFWHSILVTNDFFDKINTDIEDEEEEGTLKLFDNRDDLKIFKKLIFDLNDFLRAKRKPFLHIQAQHLIEKYENEKVFPSFGEEEWDKAREYSLKELIKGMYEVEPAVFTKLNTEQKKVFLQLLNLVMDSSERDGLFKIIGAVVELDKKERDDFAKLLKTTRLNQVITTIKLISDRILILDNLKKIVFDHELKANERDHLQKFIEKHYWILGEEFRLVCSEEVKFEEALKRYIYILRGIEESEYINHQHKYKEMDLFLAGTDFRDGKPHNLIIEIKNPTTIKKLTDKEVGQIKKYIDVILKQDKFNDHNEFWSFYLIGQDYEDIVKDDIQNFETGLLRKKDNHSLYVKKWSEIINEVERRLKYLLDKLKIEREKLSSAKTLDGIIEESNSVLQINKVPI